MICTNLDGFSLANHGQFTKFANVSPRQSFSPYGMYVCRTIGKANWKDYLV